MAEIRKDYLLDRFVIIATERGKRPKDFAITQREISPSLKCPFCPGNENMIPGVIEEIKEGNSWIARAIWNKYKAVGAQGNSYLRTDNDFYTFGGAIGEHEVIIETPRHGKEMEDLETAHIEKVLKLLIRRIKDNYSKNSEYVAVFKNRGDEGGASLSHSHHQIVSFNVFPKEIKDDVDAVQKFKEKNHYCPYCSIISREKDSERSIFQNEHFVVFSPYASRFALEAWILPKRCIHSITELGDGEIKTLATILKDRIKTLDKLNYPGYNLFYKISNDKNKDYHFRIEIAPRLAKWAGFEYSTGIVINTVSPESAARFYRGEE